MTTEDGFLRALEANPLDQVLRGAYADWLAEHDREGEAECLRTSWMAEVYRELGLEDVRTMAPAITWVDLTSHDRLQVRPGTQVKGLAVRIGPDMLYLPSVCIRRTQVDVSSRAAFPHTTEARSVGEFFLVEATPASVRLRPYR